MLEQIQFLIEAKKATYAGKGPQGQSSRPASHDLEFMRGNLKYIDTYLGAEKFAGQEALWEDDKPFWAMNYIGRVTAAGFNPDFLKAALLRVPEEKPFRGPEHYSEGQHSYKCSVTGDFSWFSGVEEIWTGETKVYECVFHGGSVKE
ncbi:DUF5680 domain-containing protein [Paenibacillus sp. FSL R7-0333]|uniref:DUF5680 domain-containing protein n=1 Tax=unclassified Paenibacillus TaxID=185978 RepID=UPI00096EB94D|nr:hypothetical protein BK146_16260 [Paenibacillus sp. FSL R7-0333]